MKTTIISLCFAIAAGLLVLTTECFAGTENGHEYVDLGLSVKWATCNVGATIPEEYGNYYAWGEVKPKEYYSRATYKYDNGTCVSVVLTKYCIDSGYGTVDDKTTLETMDDAASVNWGGTWRMPTIEEWKELCRQCTWTWTSRNGKNGYEVKSKTNGNSIFLPAAGYRREDYLYNAVWNGYYWSSSHSESMPDRAWEVEFESDYTIDRGRMTRFFGLSVRPICP